MQNHVTSIETVCSGGSVLRDLRGKFIVPASQLGLWLRQPRLSSAAHAGCRVAPFRKISQKWGVGVHLVSLCCRSEIEVALPESVWTFSSWRCSSLSSLLHLLRCSSQVTAQRRKSQCDCLQSTQTWPIFVGYNTALDCSVPCRISFHLQ